jgi:hypothetical protein
MKALKSQNASSIVAIPAERIEGRILLIRGMKVMLDMDLARLYGVSTKRLNEQVKRNRNRFPADFMFRLSRKEKAEVVANCDHLQNLKYSPTLPHAFTEHGAVMLASVLNSPTAIQASVQIVRAFLRLRQMLEEHKELARRLDELESKYDAQFKVVFDAIRELMSPKVPARGRIGFTAGEAKRR